MRRILAGILVAAGVLLSEGCETNTGGDVPLIIVSTETEGTMGISQNDAFAILARNVRITDDGDRRALADFLGRDADAPDTFGPLPEDENSDNRSDDEKRENTDKGDSGQDTNTDRENAADLNTAKDPAKPSDVAGKTAPAKTANTRR